MRRTKYQKTRNLFDNMDLKPIQLSVWCLFIKHYFTIMAGKSLHMKNMKAWVLELCVSRGCLLRRYLLFFDTVSSSFISIAPCFLHYILLQRPFRKRLIIFRSRHDKTWLDLGIESGIEFPSVLPNFSYFYHVRR